VGTGHRGPITQKLQKEFFALIGGAVPDRYGWLSPVHARQPVGVDK
jgi:branched-chain amino acid aminotransferase